MFAAFLRPSFLFPCSTIRNSRSPSLANKLNLEAKSLRLVMKKYMFKFERVYYKTYIFSMINILRTALCLTIVSVLLAYVSLKSFKF